MKLKIEINIDTKELEENPDELADVLATIGNRVAAYGESKGEVYVDRINGVAGTFRVTER